VVFQALVHKIPNGPSPELSASELLRHHDVEMQLHHEPVTFQLVLADLLTLSHNRMTHPHFKMSTGSPSNIVVPDPEAVYVEISEHETICKLLYYVIICKLLSVILPPRADFTQFYGIKADNDR